MSKPKIANYQTSGFTSAKREFKANNIFADWVRDENGARYIVCSYGQHWPMYIYDSTTDQWYANSSKYSVSTSKHSSQARPNIRAGTTTTTEPAAFIPLHVDDMIKVAAGGITRII